MKSLSDSIKSAKKAGLHYVNATDKGFGRQKKGKSFVYFDTKKKILKNPKHLARIKALVIPPAWQEVWICTQENGHIQATGLDQRGRKQYRYHNNFRKIRDEGKFERMLEFGMALPKIRQKIEEDLKIPGLKKEKVLAAVIKLLESTLIRIGNEEYARENKSYGLTTMKDQHVKVKGDQMRFKFVGKSGIKHAIDLENKQLARIVKKCQDLPGEELFQFINDDGEVQDIKSTDVNIYLKEITGEDFSAKDFRTWAGTVLAARELKQTSPFENMTEAKKNIVRMIDSVSRKLGNTKAVCRKSYVHPVIINGYFEGKFWAFFARKTSKFLGDTQSHELFIEEEKHVMGFLEMHS